ncbi:MAG: CoB--CoM heterodisulfide reductase iron-sulfur subunit B family protein [Veillonella sp.]|nr:CoB--CoM heterodisulfide reductase iron-sulfur subunit B family protein [Veillonella sp.]
MSKKYAFFPGCVLESAAKEDYLATVAVAKKLGIDIQEIDGWTCCGASHVQDIEPEVILATNARNLALAEEMGLDVLTVCNTCTLMLTEAKHELDNNQAKKDATNAKLAKIGKEYKGTSDVTHFLWVLIRDYGLDNLKAKVVKPLTGLRVAEFYGCHILRPQAELGFEDYQIPSSLADIISAIGATPIDFSRKVDCCGFHAVYPAHDSVMQMTGSINADAEKEGADCVVTPCPLCQMQLDMFQEEAKKTVALHKDMPILHMSQLIGLALGISPEEMGMPSRHLTSTAAVEKFVR